MVCNVKVKCSCPGWLRWAGGGGKGGGGVRVEEGLFLESVCLTGSMQDEQIAPLIAFIF